jgi:hypothetical protein
MRNVIHTQLESITNLTGNEDRAASPSEDDCICSVVTGFDIGAALRPLSILVARVSYLYPYTPSTFPWVDLGPMPLE